jgi:archaellum component FlaC
MSEERLERIEGKVDILVSGQIELSSPMGQVEGPLDRVEGRIGGINERLDGIDARLVGIDERLGGVEERQDTLHAAVQQVAEGHAAITRQIARGFESLHTVLDQRLTPLEDTVREHSAILRAKGLMP